jgi:RND family efflux transporter MFP subunit
MKKQLALWKQVAIVVVMGSIGYGAWLQRDYLTTMAGISTETPDERAGRRGGRGGAATASDAVPVIVEQAGSAQAVDIIRAIGTGRAERSVTLYPKQSGIITSVELTAGQHVEQGRELVRLDDSQEKLAVSLAEAKFSEAQRNLERSTSLLNRDAVSQVTVDTAKTALETTRLELEQVKQSLADRTIRAPFAGVVGIPSIEEGDFVTQSTPLITLDDRDTIILEFDVAELFLGRLKQGLEVEATNGGFRDRIFKGAIASIDSRLEATTRSVRVRAELPNSDDLLRAGMSFVVTVRLEGEEYPTIDELALRWEREGAYVWRIADSKADKVRVEVIKRLEGRVFVAGDLKEGELIAVEGTQRLRPGREVTFDEPTVEAPGSAGL